jgi:hypothetical protein
MTIGFALLLLLGAAPAGAQDGDGVELTVQAFLCPEGFEGGDVFTQCVEPAEGVGVSVSIDGTLVVEDEIGADGSVFFGDLATGDFLIELGVPGDFAEFQTVCTAPGANEALTIEGSGTNQIGIELGEGAQPTCTFFVIREDASGLTPTPAAPGTTPAAPGTTPATPVATSPAGPVAGLPNTGAGPAVAAAPSGAALLVFLGLGALLSGGLAVRRLRLG